MKHIRVCLPCKFDGGYTRKFCENRKKTAKFHTSPFISDYRVLCLHPACTNWLPLRSNKLRTIGTAKFFQFLAPKNFVLGLAPIWDRLSQLTPTSGQRAKFQPSRAYVKICTALAFVPPALVICPSGVTQPSGALRHFLRSGPPLKK